MNPTLFLTFITLKIKLFDRLDSMKNKSHNHSTRMLYSHVVKRLTVQLYSGGFEHSGMITGLVFHSIAQSYLALEWSKI